MKKENIIVPKGKCPLEVLANLGKKSSDAWIFLHWNVLDQLRSSLDRIEEYCNSFYFEWNKTPQASMRIAKTPEGHWHKVYTIQSNSIAFGQASFDPEEIIFLKMEE
ncbi:MAG: hypothetical protein J6J60_03430 [Clostridia bacterium]|nr:hypothetical protein [Clostridia bacterium]